MTPTPHPEPPSPVPASPPAVETREIITLCRQMGNMMEAGVDILRITRVLRSQTENPQLLQFYDDFDHDLRLGRSVADAMANAPEFFSPFAVSLVQEGEERNDIAGSLFKIADFLQSEAAIGEWAEIGPHEAADQAGAIPAAHYATLHRRSIAIDDSSALQESLWRLFTSGLSTLAVLLFVESLVAAVVAAGFLSITWWPATGLLLAAVTIAGSAWWCRHYNGRGNSGHEPSYAPAVQPETVPAASSTGAPTEVAGDLAPAVSPAAPLTGDTTDPGVTKKADAAPSGDKASQEDVVWPTAEEENAAYSKVWQRSAPQEEQYD